MRLISALIPLSLFCLTFSIDSLSDDFRKSTWGDSLATVKQIAGEPDQSKDGYLIYEVSISNIDAGCLYNFIADKLSSAGYIFTESHSNDNAYISDYSTIQNLLAQKYGKPASDKSIWLNDLYRDDISEHGFAVSLGHYVKQETWETERTKIVHTLRGDNYKVNHGIIYSSKELESLSDDMKKKKAMEQL